MPKSKGSENSSGVMGKTSFHISFLFFCGHECPCLLELIWTFVIEMATNLRHVCVKEASEWQISHPPQDRVNNLNVNMVNLMSSNTVIHGLKMFSFHARNYPSHFKSYFEICLKIKCLDLNNVFCCYLAIFLSDSSFYYLQF